MEYLKMEEEKQNNVRLFVKHEEVNRVTDEEFDSFYQDVKSKLGASSSVSILNGQNKDGNIIEFRNCKNPQNL